MDNKLKNNNKVTSKLNTNNKNNVANNSKIKKNNFNRNIIIASSSFIVVILFLLSFMSSRVKIQGKVFDSKDSSISLTGVSLSIDDNKTIENNTLTGGFTFEKVSKGLHTLKASRAGYKVYQKEIEVSSNLKLDIPLEPLDNVVKKSNLRLLVNNSNTSNLSIIEPELDNKISSIVVGERPSDFIINSDRQKMS
ncbi:MAG: carboxypeptidase-like regulatory domain-containing protein, partial [Candidatus Sericytochromatia bacterium]